MRCAKFISSKLSKVCKNLPVFKALQTIELTEEIRI